MKKDKIIFVLDALHGTQYHRMMIPSVSMKDVGINVGGVQSLPELFKRPDLNQVYAVVVSRFAIVPNHKNLRKWLDALGIKLVVDVDDRWYIDGDKHHMKFYNEKSRPVIEATLKIADVIWAGSKYLAKRIEKSFNIDKRKIHYVPNGINDTINDWKATPQIERDEPLFGYVGAMGHDYDIQMLKGVFDGKKIAVVDFPDSYKAGYQNYVDFFGEASVPYPVLELHEYGKMYDDINVAISPLAKTDFNLCKSNLKAVESGFKKRPLIASNVSLYKEIVEHGKNGLLCGSRAEWIDAVNYMDMQRAIDMGEALYERVKDEYSVHTINKIRFQSIFA